MSDWVVTADLLSLRAEFDAVAPHRDRGADGTRGDANHTSSSDHTPDEDSDVLRGRDADTINEVHALDIDSSGPWPGGAAWFDNAVLTIVDRHRRGEDDRLQYVIWNRRIANRDIDNWRWREYKGTSDPHVDHAHFSSRYASAAERDTSPWGIQEDDMDFSTELKLTRDAAKALGTAYDEGEMIAFATATNLELIHAARASAGVGTLNNRVAGIETVLADISTRLTALGNAVAKLSAATGADLDATAADMARRLTNE